MIGISMAQVVLDEFAAFHNMCLHQYDPILMNTTRLPKAYRTLDCVTIKLCVFVKDTAESDVVAKLIKTHDEKLYLWGKYK